MKTTVIIQARMGSSRLPGKILKPLGDSSILDYVVSRCQMIEQIDTVVVATSDQPADDQVQDWCKHNGISYFRGSEHDVLARYYNCAKQYPADVIIRVTADCPFVDYHLATKLLAEMDHNRFDYIKLAGELVRGFNVELFSYRALSYIFKHGHQERHREHVTYYGYEYPEQFKYKTVQAPSYLCHPELRVTVDTIEDYQMVEQITRQCTTNKYVSSEEVVAFLLANPKVASINAHVKQKPVR
ncbi:spore coat polysaccharide biosynthesis protein SpsF [Natronobacillus azotifigens]|uniref:Glycosyltransferase family protein n=1 Tax=Natronobacillus azotifigens TaxID=472978 RepID=A0A9J6R902_9BACI|nr:glycosyltransferase family protein [Natronobacillus azotifigens]MCZ0702101.1 glycosyltransferase family protein [Natronobacillus azotifigens]